MASDKGANGFLASIGDKGLSKLSDSITSASGDLKLGVKVEHGLDKIAVSILGASVIFASIQLLSTSSIGLNKFEIENLRQKTSAEPSTNFLVRNYVLLASAVVVSLGTVFYVSGQLKR